MSGDEQEQMLSAFVNDSGLVGSLPALINRTQDHVPNQISIFGGEDVKDVQVPEFFSRVAADQLAGPIDGGDATGEVVSENDLASILDEGQVPLFSFIFYFVFEC